MIQELLITDRSKLKAQKKRQYGEYRWLPYRVATIIFVLVCIVSFCIGIFCIDWNDYDLFATFSMIFSVTLVSAAIARALLVKSSSHWIQDRLNERMCIQEGYLYHFMQTSFAAGLNTYHADERAYLFAMDISTIRDARYDSTSGRIEFNVDGRGIHYSDYRRNVIDKDWPLCNFGTIFYDASEPSLFELLESYGVHFQIGTIDYKFTNQI